MAITKLSSLIGYEVSLVPRGANLKKRFLVTKEDGELNMDKLLQQILKEGMKDEEAIDKVAKGIGLDEEEGKTFKAIMKILGAESCPLSKEKLMKALGEMGVKKEEMSDGKQPNTEKECDGEVEMTDPKENSQVNKEGSNPINKGGKEMPRNAVPVQKEDGSWDLSKVDDSMRPVLEVVCKSNEQLTKALEVQKTENKTLADKLKAETDARVLKEFEDKAKAYGHLGEDAKNLAKVLKSIHDADPENGAAIETILKSANDKIEQGELFSEKGVSGSGAMVGATAWSKIEKQAEGFVKADPSLSHADAVDLVLKRHPELYDEYNQEKRRGV